MGGTKNKTQQQNTQQAQTTNTYQHIAPPVTPEVEEAKSVAKNLRGEVNPIIRSSYAKASQDLDDSFINPMGEHTTAAIRDATLRSGKENLRQDEQSALAGAEFAANNADFSNSLAIAGMTAPQLVQTGGTSTGNSTGTSTQQQSSGVLNGIIGGAAQVGSAALL